MEKTYNVSISNVYEIEANDKIEAEIKAKLNFKNGIQAVINGDLDINDFIDGFVFDAEEET